MMDVVTTSALPGAPALRAGAPGFVHSTAEPVPSTDPGTFHELLINKLPRPPIPQESSGLNNAVPEGLAPEKAEQIENTARDFESLVVYMLLKQMWESVPRTGLLDSGLSTKFFEEMWLEEIGNIISQQESGIGLATSIERQLFDIEDRTLTPEELRLLESTAAGSSPYNEYLP